MTDVATPRPRIALHLGLQILIRFGGLASGLLGVAFLARGMSTADFGRFTVCLSIVALATGLTELGLNSAAVREFSLRTADAATIAGALLAGRVASSLVAAAASIVALVATFGADGIWLPGLLVVATLLL